MFVPSAHLLVWARIAKGLPSSAFEHTGLRNSFSIAQVFTIFKSRRAVRTKNREIFPKLQKDVWMVMRRTGADTFELADADLD